MAKSTAAMNSYDPSQYVGKAQSPAVGAPVAPETYAPNPYTTALNNQLLDLGQRIEILTAALAQKDKQHEAMLDFICEMNGRLFCYEMTHGVRGLNSARFDVSGISFRYPGSFDTYKMICELTRKKLLGKA